MSYVSYNLAKCVHEGCGHKRMVHQLQPRPVLCRDCQDEDTGKRVKKAEHVFRAEGDPT